MTVPNLMECPFFYPSGWNAERAYGIACYDFQGQYADELPLREGQTVYLLKHVNDEWIHGESNGKQGIFPTSFITIIKDCQPQVQKPEARQLEAQKLEIQKPEASAEGPTINWTAQPTRSEINLDSVIARNLNQLETSVKSPQSGFKQSRLDAISSIIRAVTRLVFLSLAWKDQLRGSSR